MMSRGKLPKVRKCSRRIAHVCFFELFETTPQASPISAIKIKKHLYFLALSYTLLYTIILYVKVFWCIACDRPYGTRWQSSRSIRILVSPHSDADMPLQVSFLMWFPSGPASSEYRAKTTSYDLALICSEIVSAQRTLPFVCFLPVVYLE